MPATISCPRRANSGPRWSIVGIAIAWSTRSGTFVGPGICRKWRPVCGGAVFFIAAGPPNGLRPISLHCSFPHSLDAIRLAFTRPGRQSGADHVEGFEPVATELKMRAGRYRDRHAGSKLKRLFVFAELAPHAPASSDDVPDFLDRMVVNRSGDRL